MHIKRVLAVIMGLAVLVVVANGQATVNQSTPFGNVPVTVNSYTAGPFGQQQMPTAIQGASSANISGASVNCSFAKKGYIAGNGTSIVEIAAGGGPGGVGWAALSVPVGLNNSYAIDTGTNLNVIAQNYANMDAAFFAMLTTDFNTLTIGGEYTLQAIYTGPPPTSSKSVLWHMDFIITGGSTALSNGPPQGGTDPTTETNTGNIASNTQATNGKLDTLNTNVTGLDNDIKSGTTAVTGAITSQNSNQSGFWGSLFVPDTSHTDELQTSLHALYSSGPFSLFAGFLGALGGYQSAVAPIDFRFTVGTIPMFGNITLDLTPYENIIVFVRGMMAGSLWWPFVLWFSRKFIFQLQKAV